LIYQTTGLPSGLFLFKGAKYTSVSTAKGFSHRDACLGGRRQEARTSKYGKNSCGRKAELSKTHFILVQKPKNWLLIF